jgi:hypothetical protein
MKHTVYLDSATNTLFKSKCDKLGMSEGEVTQQLIRAWLNPNAELLKVERQASTRRKIVEFFLIVNPEQQSKH